MFPGLNLNYSFLIFIILSYSILFLTLTFCYMKLYCCVILRHWFNVDSSHSKLVPWGQGLDLFCLVGNVHGKCPVNICQMIGWKKRRLKSLNFCIFQLPASSPPTIFGNMRCSVLAQSLLHLFKGHCSCWSDFPFRFYKGRRVVT